MNIRIFEVNDGWGWELLDADNYPTDSTPDVYHSAAGAVLAALEYHKQHYTNFAIFE